MEDDDCWTQRRHVDVVRLEALSGRLQLRRKVSPERNRRVAKELEEVAMETVGSSTIYDEVRHSQHLHTLSVLSHAEDAECM